MSARLWRRGGAIVLLFAVLSTGCASSYKGIVKPTPKMSLLSPEAQQLTENDINILLTADVSVEFPTVLAVGKLKSQRQVRYGSAVAPRLAVKMIYGDEANRWRGLTSTVSEGGDSPISQIHLLNDLAVNDEVNLKNLRGAAASLHAPLLFVYIQEDEQASGFNDLAMAYWTIVGLFFVPGDTVACYSVCQGILVDTRTGVMLATISAEAKREETVLTGAVPIARKRTRTQAREEAMTKFQNELAKTIAALANKPQGENVTDAGNR